MKVIMLLHISGSRSGAQWPPAGGALECSRREAMELIRAGLAAPAPPEPEPPTERAVMPEADVELRDEEPVPPPRQPAVVVKPPARKPPEKPPAKKAGAK